MPRRKIEPPLYVAARGTGDRPMCIHRVTDRKSVVTACGRNLEQWSLEYLKGPTLEILQCRATACRRED
jgi:hypothetical protein